MKKQTVTISDIAREANVSKTIVSNYLNGRLDTMSEATANKLKQIIDTKEYEPNVSRRNFKRKPTDIIGLVIPDITDSFIAALCKGISDAGFDNNYSVIIGNTDNNIVREQTFIKKMADKIDGLIIGTVGDNEQILSSLGNKIPVILADRRINSLECDIISSNNHEAVQELMNYLCVIGYEAFALFMEKPLNGAARTIRRDSYLEFAEANLPKNSASVHVIDINDEKTIMKELTDFLAQSKGKKRVIFAANGRTMLHTISVVQTMGLRFPEDIGLCGYDDFEWASIIHSGITTIYQPSYEMGYRCVEQLIRRIREANGAEFVREEIILRSKLIIRGSL